MKLPDGATVAVVDGTKVKLFRNSGHEDTPSLTALPEPTVNQDNHGSGAGHHSSSANPDHGQLEEDSHSAGVAAMLNKAATTGTIKNLVVIASPRALGELRKHYSKPLSAVLDKEIAKDLTGHPIPEIEKAIAAA
ncbi:host attachment protein [Lichenihabitans sp. Uapishka_5]|uniref:host attachment family protein n=1 Tax=Lichenihabitans sp. Uapishka_5 TaxID=3037302 RepID=UPI0029E7F478|nr:host attachment protein [Lichenihabitans sp. Uapishka_5]MDX7952597.1 host attachment protein [Lichenihabitans sp. Uapishka_5]